MVAVDGPRPELYTSATWFISSEGSPLTTFTVPGLEKSPDVIRRTGWL